MNITRQICFKSFSRALAKDREGVQGMQGRIQNIQKGMAGIFAGFIDIFYFSENLIKIIQNFKEKGVAAVPSASP